MKKNLAIYITALTLFATLAIPVQLAAQDEQDHHHMHNYYQLIDIGTFGGPRVIPSHRLVFKITEY